MDLWEGRERGRIRLVAIFALLLFACSVVPAFGDSSSESSSPEAPSSVAESAAPAQPPTGDDIAAGIAELERKEAEQAERLATPEARLEREVSRTAFANAGPEEAARLLNTKFSAVLGGLNSDPARFLSDATLVRPLGETGAAVVSPDGGKQLLEAGIPVRAENEEGELSKVDLSLGKTPEGYEPTNPLVDLSIGASASEGVEIGDAGLTISQVGAEEGSTAVAFGDKNILYPEIQEGADIDQLVSPTATGVEIFDQLRSADSPETLRFHLDLPPKASLRPDGANGAVVISGDDSILTQIPAPSATDAQGTPVPVALEVEGDAVVLRINHQGADLAYPILVDPELKNESFGWEWGNNLAELSYWSWSSNDESQFAHSTSCIYQCWGSSRGLYTSSVNGTIPANAYGQWYYSVPGTTTYIPSIYPTPSVTVGLHRSNHGCNWEPYPQPHDYDGVWDGEKWAWLETDRAQWYGGDSMYTKGKVVVIGLSTGASAVSIPCWRDIDTGSVSVWLDDPESPTLTAVSGMPSSNTWLGKNKSITVEATATDPGLGVQKILARGGPESIWEWDQSWCSGLWSQRCAATRSGHITFNTNGLYQGETSIAVQPLDPTGKGAGTQNYSLRVDREGPLLNLSGQLATATKEQGPEEHPQSEGDDELSLPTYKLNIEATDAKEGQVRSGVKEISVYLDGGSTPVASESKSCPQNSCSLTMPYTLKLNELTPGQHTLKVTATDWAGNEAEPERKIEFEYVPATGIKDEYILQHIPLPDGQDHSEEEEPHGPELAVNVINGNLVYHERDFEVKGRDADLELERFYNSQLPDEKDTEWGDGWTAAQMPELAPDLEELPPSEAAMVESSGAIANDVEIPESEGQQTFDPNLHASIEKTPTAGYEVAYEDKEEEPVFSPGGEIEETRYPSGAAVKFGAIEEEAAEEEAAEEGGVIRALGSPGVGDGEFVSPFGIALDPEGNILVADSGNHRIQKFNSEGEYLSQFGSEGEGEGQLSHPFGVAVDPEGNIWVANYGDNRIEEFNSAGEYLRQFGTEGSGDGEFLHPVGIAVDPEGHVWITDMGNHRIQEFSSEGEYLNQVGSEGSGEGEFLAPAGIAADPEGHIWVTDMANRRVQEFSSSSGEYLSQFGSEGTGDGQFSSPFGIAIDSTGNLWVGDDIGNRIQEFNAEGEYLNQMGSPGSEEGQLSYAAGVVVSPEGNIWVADSGNYRIQEYSPPPSSEVEDPEFIRSFGSKGTGNGQFSSPGRVTVDPAGAVWVSDYSANRIQKFNSSGEYLGQVGSYGSGNGQFHSAFDVAADPAGNIWVADPGNSRIQKFNSKGEYLRKTGSAGSGNGKFQSPYGVAVDPAGNLLVADTGNHRIEKFNPKGEYLSQFGTSGSGAGQFIMPYAIDVDDSGDIWVADYGNHRIEKFNPKGEYLSQFGSMGTGKGQFLSISDLAVDTAGDVWVADFEGNRIQEFNSAGEYLGQFGSKGSGDGQFSGPYGIAADPNRNLWVIDNGNSRVQQFSTGPAPVTGMAIVDPNATESPSAAINVDEGLVSSVEGEEAGTTEYSYDEGKLTAKEGEEGETTYGYDSSGRLNQIELPNGTTAEIVYDSLSRVTEVTVDPAGSEGAKTTHFWYGAEPRETKVWGGGSPEVTYSIGEDGSVFKWAYAEVEANLDLSGSLPEHAEDPNPIPNKDQALHASATSPHQIEEIQILVNGNVVVAEKTCEDDHETPKLDCENVNLEWVTSAAAHPAGRLDIEVIATDFLGHSVAKRFFVTIPQQPPVDPEAPVPPTFADTKQFLEEFGLDKGLWNDEEKFNEFIFSRLGAYENQNEPAAQKGVALWGVPLTAGDIEEMEYRERYIAQDGPLIRQWAEANAPSSYAGYYVDHRAGGIIHVGFTSNQEVLLSQLKLEIELIAPERVVVFENQPQHSLQQLAGITNELPQHLQSRPDIVALLAKAGTDVRSNRVAVGATDPSMVNSYFAAIFGSGAPIIATFDPNKPVYKTARARSLDTQLFGGDWLSGTEGKNTFFCSVGFGASEELIRKPNEEPTFAHFALTAGHCYSKNVTVYRVGRKEGGYDKTEIGKVSRRAYGELVGNYFYSDGEAIRLESAMKTPKAIYLSSSRPVAPVNGVEAFVPGGSLCTSGTYSGYHCGVAGEPILAFPGESMEWVVPTTALTTQGDSGGSVWDPATGNAVGLVSSGPIEGLSETWLTPLLPVPLPVGTAPGFIEEMDAPGGGVFNIARGWSGG